MKPIENKTIEKMNMYKDVMTNRYTITIYTPEIQLNWVLWKTNVKNMDYSNMLYGLKRLIFGMKQDKYYNSLRLYGCEGYSETIADICVDSEFISYIVNSDGMVSETKILAQTYGKQFLEYMETIYNELKAQIPKKESDILDSTMSY